VHLAGFIVRNATFHGTMNSPYTLSFFRC